MKNAITDMVKQAKHDRVFAAFMGFDLLMLGYLIVVLVGRFLA